MVVSGRVAVGVCVFLAATVGEARSAGEDEAGGRFYLVGGVGYVSSGGSADAADNREAGWHFYGGIRRTLPRRITIGAGAEYSVMDLDPARYFSSREIFPPRPENNLVGGKLAFFGATGELFWDFPVSGSTIPYVTVGGGYYSWTVDLILVRDPTTGEDEQIVIPDESGFGFRAGGGVRFPIGESAGLWAEVIFHFVGADGGTLQITPARVGFSFP
jgi:hypothetical protein